MLKHTEILNKMSAKQKITLISDVHRLADDEYRAFGIPLVKFCTLDELFAKDGNGLTPYALARSWNTELITRVTSEIIEKNADDSNVILVPSPKINLGGEADVALSEDPMLSTEISLAFLSAVNSCKRIGVIPDFYLTEKDVANMDIEPDDTALHDFIYEPFSNTVKNGQARAVVASLSKNAGAYEDFNRGLLRHKESYFPTETEMLCLCKTYDDTILALDENCIIFTGIEVAIQNAYDQYLSILSSIEKGRASMLNLEEAFEHKTAISDQMLDAAADKVLSFAFHMQELYEELHKEPVQEATDTESGENTADTVHTEESTAQSEDVEAQKNEEYARLISLATEKSSVFLKNESVILPLGHGKTFAIIGDAALIKNGDGTSFAECFAESMGETYSYVGSERGYEMLEDRSDSLIAPAVALAKKASVVFVFLKPRESQSTSYPCTSLPANQTALVDALSASKCHVIAVMESDVNLDVSFSKSIDGLVLAPISGQLSAQALASIVSGRSCPGGKLTTSFYTSPSKFYKKQRFYKDNARNKVSLFVGYRFYDTQDISISYPFGFGLKYSNIEISNVKYNPGRFVFSVTNTGKFDIDETVEIYVGHATSKLLRPKKTLKAFRTLRIKAGRTQQVTINGINLRSYDATTQSDMIEDGLYTILIGTSVSTIKATTNAAVHGKAAKGERPVLSDYLQSQTNITSNDFILEAKHNRMIKVNYTNLRNAGFICLVVAILVSLMSISAASPLLPLAIGIVILLGAVALFVAAYNLRERVKQEEAELIEKNKELFQNAEVSASEKLEDLFLSEFKFDVTDSTFKVNEEDEVYVDNSAAMLNDSMTFALAGADYKRSAAEFGVNFDSHLASNVIAAFASSRLIIAKSANKESFDSFVEATANYFGAALFTEAVTDNHKISDRLLRVTAEDGSLLSTAVLNALISAAEKPQVMHIVHLKDLPVDKISHFLIPYIKYLSNPYSGAEISAKGSDEIYVSPSNVWFVTKLESGALVESVPPYVLEYATVLPVKHTECQPTEEKSEFVPITITDFEYLTERCKTKFTVSEDVWKKIDAIEAFAFKHASYKIGNKLWLRVESYIATLLSTDTELPVAIDSALASVILPTLASVLAGKINDTDKNLIDEIERLFGEYNVQISHEMIVSKA